jgi:RNA polymerase sigma-70 factor (ECF subfamily)
VKGPDNSSPSDGDPSPSSSTSLTLLEQVKQGDRHGWERLVALYRPLLLWWCRGQVARREDAEDVAQEVFQTVFRRIDEFTRQPGQGGFRAWLRAITRHKLGDYFRRAGHQLAAAGGGAAQELLAELPAESGDSSSEEAASERCLVLRSAMELVRAEFQPRTWEAAWKAAVEGQAASAVAEALGMTTAAVHIAKSRVLKRLRQELDTLLD